MVTEQLRGENGHKRAACSLSPCACTHTHTQHTLICSVSFRHRTDEEGIFKVTTWNPDGVWCVDNDLGDAKQHFLHIHVQQRLETVVSTQVRTPEMKSSTRHRGCEVLDVQTVPEPACLRCCFFYIKHREAYRRSASWESNLQCPCRLLRFCLCPCKGALGYVLQLSVHQRPPVIQNVMCLSQSLRSRGADTLSTQSMLSPVGVL